MLKTDSRQSVQQDPSHHSTKCRDRTPGERNYGLSRFQEKEVSGHIIYHIIELYVILSAWHLRSRQFYIFLIVTFKAESYKYRNLTLRLLVQNSQLNFNKSKKTLSIFHFFPKI